MIILDAPYASETLIQWVEKTAHPVLRNAFTEELVKKGCALHLVEDEEAAQRVESGERLYSNSENALAWVLEKVDLPSLCEPIALFKDKNATREALAPLNPDLYFKKCGRDELQAIDVEKLSLPVVLKPSVGFCSMGVYVIASAVDWSDALADIAATEASWNEMYPNSVIDSGTYIIEGFITGTEYALDAYFDEQGTPHLLNIFRHDFANDEDTSDRVYNTNAQIIEETQPLFLRWLTQVNEIVGARNLPVHIEVRVQNDSVVPIEFNPLRFAGLGGTDLAYYAWGLYTYGAFLSHDEVDLLELAQQKPSSTFTMSLLSPASGMTVSPYFDYDSFASKFGKVLNFRQFDVRRIGAWGFLFLETNEETQGELAWLLNAQLEEFLK